MQRLLDTLRLSGADRPERGLLPARVRERIASQEERLKAMGPAVEAYRTGGTQFESPGRTPPGNQSSRFHYGHAGIELVAYLFQPPGAETPDSAGREESSEGSRLPMDGLPQPGPDVEYEVLPFVIDPYKAREEGAPQVMRLHLLRPVEAEEIGSESRV